MYVGRVFDSNGITEAVAAAASLWKMTNVIFQKIKTNNNMGKKA